MFTCLKGMRRYIFELDTIVNHNCLTDFDIKYPNKVDMP